MDRDLICFEPEEEVRESSIVCLKPLVGDPPDISIWYRDLFKWREVSRTCVKWDSFWALSNQMKLCKHNSGPPHPCKLNPIHRTKQRCLSIIGSTLLLTPKTFQSDWLQQLWWLYLGVCGQGLGARHVELTGSNSRWCERCTETWLESIR